MPYRIVCAERFSNLGFSSWREHPGTACNVDIARRAEPLCVIRARRLVNVPLEQRVVAQLGRHVVGRWFPLRVRGPPPVLAGSLPVEQAAAGGACIASRRAGLVDLGLLTSQETYRERV